MIPVYAVIVQSSNLGTKDKPGFNPGSTVYSPVTLSKLLILLESYTRPSFFLLWGKGLTAKSPEPPVEGLRFIKKQQNRAGLQDC